MSKAKSDPEGRTGAGAVRGDSAPLASAYSGGSRAHRLDAEGVMQRVRAEIAASRGWAPGPGGSPVVNPVPWRSAILPDAGKREFVLSELLAASDQTFVDVAYRALLRRAPDSQGNEHFLRALRSGEISKIEILGVLRWSAEGRARSVHVDGLLLPYILRKWQRKALVGPLVAWIHAFLRLGVVAQRQQQLEAAAAWEAHGLGGGINALGLQLQQLSTRAERINEQAHAELERLGVALEEGRGREDRQDGRMSEHEAELDAHRSSLRAHDAALRAIEQAKAAAVEGARALDPLYVAFEDAFRGSRDLVRARAEPYVSFVVQAGAGTPAAPVLDLGCGRGEWLELLRDRGLAARGIDSNRILAESCRGRGLDVMEGDVIEVMRTLPDASMGAITGFHIAEHLPFEALIRLLDESRRLLVPGGLVALETPNPENLQVATHYFYMDPTHRNPLPPDALRWIVEARGFEATSIERWTLAREMNAPPLLDDAIPGAASLNVLLAQLAAAPDYAIIARRGAA